MITLTLTNAEFIDLCGALVTSMGEGQEGSKAALAIDVACNDGADADLSDRARIALFELRRETS